MDWKDIAGAVGKAAPILGTLIGGPAGGAIGALISSGLGVANSPDAVEQALQVNPDAAVKLAQIEKDRQVELQGLLVQSESSRLAAETTAIAAVNQTMQAESASEHWPTYSWRPAIGFCVAFNTASAAIAVIGVYGAVMFGVPGAALALPHLPLAIGSLAALSGTVLPILGIASYFRGRMQADPGVPTSDRG